MRSTDGTHERRLVRKCCGLHGGKGTPSYGGGATNEVTCVWERHEDGMVVGLEATIRSLIHYGLAASFELLYYTRICVFITLLHIDALQCDHAMMH